MFRTAISTLAVGVAGLTLVAAQGAAASPKMSDAQYVAAARCQALIAAPALGGGDTHVIDQLMRDQSRGRTAQAEDMADSAHDDASRQASHPGDWRRSELVAERDGACRALIAPIVAGQDLSPTHGR